MYYNIGDVVEIYVSGIKDPRYRDCRPFIMPEYAIGIEEFIKLAESISKEDRDNFIVYKTPIFIVGELIYNYGNEILYDVIMPDPFYKGKYRLEQIYDRQIHSDGYTQDKKLKYNNRWKDIYPINNKEELLVDIYGYNECSIWSYIEFIYDNKQYCSRVYGVHYIDILNTELIGNKNVVVLNDKPKYSVLADCREVIINHSDIIDIML